MSDKLIKDTPKDTNYLKDSNADFQAIYLSIKAKKIVSAIYLITEFMDKFEPLKWKCRELSVSMASGFHIGQSGLKISEHTTQNIKDILLQLISFIDLSFISGLISEMNYSILKRELSLLEEGVNKQNIFFCGPNHSKVNELVCDDDFLMLSEDKRDEVLNAYTHIAEDFIKRTSTTAAQPTRQVSKGHSIKDNYKGQANVLYNNERVDTNKTITNKLIHDNKPVAVGNDKEARRTEIKLALQGNGGLTIKEIISALGGVKHSEKTVQRDLLEMVSFGLLQKSGERRWSRYSII